MNMTTKKETFVPEKIKDLNLIALRKYACPKIQSQNDWYLKCIECKGLDGCPAGKRAIELIESQTKPEQKSQTEKFNERLQKTLAIAKTSSRNKNIIEAIEKGGDDPGAYLYNLGGYPSKWRARDTVKQWLKRHGFSITDISGMGDQRHIKKVEAIKKAADSRTMKARANIEKLFENTTTKEEKIRVILENETKDTITGHTIRNRLYNWSVTYPDLYEKYGLKEVYKEFSSKTNQRLTVSGLKIQLLHEPVMTKTAESEKEEDDEISIEDFLAESEAEESNNVETPATVIPDPEQTAEEEKEKARNEELNTLVNYSTDILMTEQFTMRINASRKEYREATEQIEKWTAYRNKIERDINTLHAAMELLGLKEEDEENE